MAPKTQHAAEVIALPPSFISRVDATRAARELEMMSGSLEQQAHHHDTDKKNERPSQILEAIIELNDLDVSKASDRDRLLTFLNDLKKDAPTIHMSFAAEPSSAFTIKLISWLRSEIHPLMLLDIGLQPSIAAGCVIRTNSKYFDCSIRQHLVESKPKLVALMRGPEHA